jgi:hypothetical protein
VRSSAIPFVSDESLTVAGVKRQRHAPAAFYPEKDPVPIVQEAGWAPEAGLDRCGKSRPNRDSIPGPSSG